MIDSAPIAATERTIVRPGMAAATPERPVGPVGSAPLSAPTPARRRWVVPVIGVLVVLAAAGAGLFVALSPKESGPASTAILLEAADVVGTRGAFADSVVAKDAIGVQGLPTDLDATVATTTASGADDAVSWIAPRGDYDSLYATAVPNATTFGNSPATASGHPAPQLCDKESLRTQLIGDDTVANAWAAKAGNGASTTDTLRNLTPLLLGQDTAVTEYAHESGEVVAYQAILQAGTAVLVDHRGQPRVRCNNGNPLREAQLGGEAKVTIEGTRWAGFDQQRVMSIRTTVAPITQLAGVVILGADGSNGVGPIALDGTTP